MECSETTRCGLLNSFAQRARVRNSVERIHNAHNKDGVKRQRGSRLPRFYGYGFPQTIEGAERR